MEIVHEVPWSDGPGLDIQHWNTASYWAHDDGIFTWDEFSDGDHEEIAGEDMPFYSEVTEGWRAYNSYVAKTGEDPLNNFLGLRDTKTRSVNWQVKFRNSILGAILVGARKNARGPWGLEVPQELADYLLLVRKHDLQVWRFRADKYDEENTGMTDSSAILRHYAETDQNVKVQRGDFLKMIVNFDQTIPNPAYSRKLKRAARLQLQRNE
jgi:hypothetical protein